jgi:hypothetical protein
MVVFTLPGTLRALAERNPDVVYNALLEAAAATLRDLARRKYHALLGVTSVLHTWTREMRFHPHVHCIVSAGGLRLDGEGIVTIDKDWLFAVKSLAKRFRHHVVQRLVAAHVEGHLDLGPWSFTTWRQKAFEKPWVVDVEPPRGRDRAQVVRYLARYVYNVAISDARIVSATDGAVTILGRDDAHVTMSPIEFVRRWSLHVLPKGFRKVRHTGLYAPGAGARLARACELLGNAGLPAVAAPQPTPDETAPPERAATAKERSCSSCGSAHVLRVPIARLADTLQVLRLAASARGPP